MPGSSTMWAWHLEQAGEMGGQVPPTVATGHQLETKDGIADNTTIGLIATDAALDQGQLQRLAVMAQDGYAYAIRPIHTHLDGDVVFALTTAAAPAAAGGGHAGAAGGDRRRRDGARRLPRGVPG